MNSDLQKLTGRVRELDDKKEELNQAKQRQRAEMRALENEIARLENVKQQRLEYLRRIDNDAYNAVLWLRNNKHLFKGEVYEPIMLEVSVLIYIFCYLTRVLLALAYGSCPPFRTLAFRNTKNYFFSPI